MAWKCVICNEYETANYVCDLVKHILNDHYNLEWRFSSDRNNQGVQELSTVYSHTLLSGKVYQQCNKCLLYVDNNGNPDQDWYSAREYFRLMNIDPDKKCKHEK